MINTSSEVRELEMADEDGSNLGNVILFPGKTRNRPPQSIEEICREVKLNKTARIEEITEIVVVELFEDLYEHGYDFSERHDANKDMAFLIEAVKSIMSKHDGMAHKFHELAETYFVADGDGDLTFTESVVDLSGLMEDGETGC
jgi:hypothetical protein